jgi:hypothetical protein
MGQFYDIVQGFVEHQLVAFFVIRWYLPPVVEEFDGSMTGVAMLTTAVISLTTCVRSLNLKIGPEFKKSSL